MLLAVSEQVRGRDGMIVGGERMNLLWSFSFSPVRSTGGALRVPPLRLRRPGNRITRERRLAFTAYNCAASFWRIPARTASLASLYRWNLATECMIRFPVSSAA